MRDAYSPVKSRSVELSYKKESDRTYQINVHIPTMIDTLSANHEHCASPSFVNWRELTGNDDGTQTVVVHAHCSGVPRRRLSVYSQSASHRSPVLFVHVPSR